MRVYVVKTRHYYKDYDDEGYDKSRVHTHRVIMPDEDYKRLQNQYSGRFHLHQWVEKKLEKRIGPTYDDEGYNTRYYVTSIKVER